MSEPVMVKSNQRGLTLMLDDEISFDALLTEIEKKFRESASFFKDAAVAVSFYGRALTLEEENLIINAIHKNCRLNIICVLDYDTPAGEITEKNIRRLNADHDRKTEERKEKPKKNSERGSARSGQFYKGTLRAGQVLESDTSIVLLGDVLEGARIVSRGNIVILGSLNGHAHAGASGNRKAFVAALDFDPVQLKIGEISLWPEHGSRSNIIRKKKKDAQIAVAKDKTIYVEPIINGFLNHI